MGGGVFELGNPEGRGAQAVLEIQVEGGGDKNRAFRCGGVDFFWNNPIPRRQLETGHSLQLCLPCGTPRQVESLGQSQNFYGMAKDSLF